MSTDHVFDHKFNAGSNWTKLAENNPTIKAWIEKEKKVWKLFAVTNTATINNNIVVSTVANTDTSKIASVDTTTATQNS